MPFCIDCKSYRDISPTWIKGELSQRCDHPDMPPHDLVTGRERTLGACCGRARMPGSPCGPEGFLFMSNAAPAG